MTPSGYQLRVMDKKRKNKIFGQANFQNIRKDLDSITLNQWEF